MRIKLSKGYSTIIDRADWDLIKGYSWAVRISRNGKVYACTWDGIRMHRLIMSAPPGLDVDHVDGDTLNNRRKNLVIKTRSQNLHGYRKDRHNMMGIRKRGKKFFASICINRKRHYATFNTLEEAQSWRNQMRPFMRDSRSS